MLQSIHHLNSEINLFVQKSSMNWWTTELEQLNENANSRGLADV